MNAGGNSVRSEFTNKAVPINAKLIQTKSENIQVPSGLTPGTDRRDLQARDGAERVIVAARDLLAKPTHFRALLQLDETDRSLQVRQIVFIARVCHFVIP